MTVSSDVQTSMDQGRSAIDADIAALDLEPIAFKVCLDEGWTLEKVDAVERKYRIFLHAARHCPDELAPSKEVDIFWHHHILDTQKYMADCDQLFGEYLHHFPYSGLFGPDDEALQAEKLSRTAQWMRLFEAEGETHAHD